MEFYIYSQYSSFAFATQLMLDNSHGNLEQGKNWNKEQAPELELTA